MRQQAAAGQGWFTTVGVPPYASKESTAIAEVHAIAGLAGEPGIDAVVRAVRDAIERKTRLG